MSEVTRAAIQAPLTTVMKSSLAQLQYYNIAQGLLSDFDRVTAERDALQLRLNAADQRIDELTAKGSLVLPERKPVHATAPDNDMRARLECKNKGYNEALDDTARLSTPQ